LKKIVKKTSEGPTILRQETENITDIAIIGMSFKLPKANLQEEFWDNITKQKNLITSISENREEITNDVIVCFGKKNASYRKMAYIDEIDTFDYKYFGMSKKEADFIDPNQRLFLENTIKAIEDSGYGMTGIKSSKTGVFVGFDSDSEYKHLVECYAPEYAKLSFVENLSAMIPGRVSHLLDLKGPSMVINTTCSSSLVALHIACESLKNKDCDMAIVGGVKLSLMPIERDLPFGNESKDGKTRVFDENANGAVSGEGVITILIKPFDQAVKEKDNIYAVIKGSAVNHNGNGASVMAPNPIAEEEVITSAWRNAKIDPSTISYIECHSIGTKWGDAIEIEGISRAFNRYTDYKKFCAVGSVKTNLGHLDSVSGLAGLVKAVIGLRNKVIPPSLPLEIPNQKINFDDGAVYYNDIVKPWNQNPRRCGVSAAGLNGTNCHIVLEGFDRPNDEIRVTKGEHIFTLSATNTDLLRDSIQDFITYLEKDTNSNRNTNLKYDLEDICYTVNTGRGRYDYGIFCIVKDKDDLLKQLYQIKQDFKDIEPSCSVRVNDELFDDVQLIDRLLTEYRLTSDSEILMQIKKLYYKGVKIDWNYLYERGKYNRVSLPTYHFEKSRCWIKNHDKYYQKEIVREVKLVGGNDGEYTTREIQISKLIAGLLDLSEIDINHSFAELGGNSILAVKLELDLEKEGLYFSNFKERIKGNIRNFAKENSDENVTNRDNDALIESKKKGQTKDIVRKSDGVIIFNDIFYKSCFYNALFTVLQSCRYSIGYFFVNNFCAYTTNNEGIIGADYQELRDCKKMLEDTKVRYRGESHVIDIVKYAVDEINQGNILLIWIDPYYALIRKDAYRLKHRSHPWVVTDVDMENKYFFIYEHTNSDSLNYQKQGVSFDELSACYDSYISLYAKDENGYSCYSFEHKHKNQKVNLDFNSIYLDNLISNKDKINSNRDALVSFIETFAEHITELDYLKANKENIIASLNELINAKKVERYVYENILKNEPGLKEVVSCVVDKLELIRSILLKYYLTDKITEKKQVLLKEELLNIKDCEKELYSLLNIKISTKDRYDFRCCIKQIFNKVRRGMK